MLILEKLRGIGVTVDQMMFQEILTTFGNQVLKVDELMPARVLEHFLVVAKRHTEAIGKFPFARRTAIFLLESSNGDLDSPKITTQAAWQPVVLAQTIEHRTTHPLRRVGFELSAHSRFETVARVEQTKHSVLYQIVDLNTGWKAGHEMTSDSLHQRREALDQLILVELTSSVIHSFVCRRLSGVDRDGIYVLAQV